MPLAGVPPFGKSEYFTKREESCCLFAVGVPMLFGLLADWLNYRAYTLYALVLFLVLYLGALALQHMRREALAKHLDDLQRTIDIS